MWQCDRRWDDAGLPRSLASHALRHQFSHAVERLFYAVLLVICRPYIPHSSADAPIVNRATQSVGELFARIGVESFLYIGAKV